MPYVNKIIFIIALAAAILFPGMAASQDGIAFADTTEGTVLRVYYDNTMLAEYKMSDLSDIAKAEGSKSYSFSRMNTYPSADLIDGVKGPTVKGVLMDAFSREQKSGLPSDLDDLDKDQLIEFKENDGSNAYRALFTIEQFNCERYYYPKVRDENGRKGAAALPSSYEGQQPVPAILSIENDKPGREGRLLIGQLAPNEQNQPDWVQGMVDSSNPGVVVIHSGKAKRLNAITRIDPGADGRVLFGEQITFDRDVNEFRESGGKRYWIYYTTDGSEPTRRSAIYNYNNYDFGESYEGINKPSVSPEAERMKLRIKVFGNGMLDSEISEFSLQGIYQQVTPPTPTMPARIIPVPAKPSIKKLKLKKKTVIVQWRAVAGADGYQIWRAEKKKTGRYKLVKIIKNGKNVSWKNKKLKKGKRYFYKIRAYRNVDGRTVYSSFSAVKYIKAK